MRLAAAFLAMIAAPVAADTILSAEYTNPTTRYTHGVLGDAIEWGNIQITTGMSVGGEGRLFSANRSFTWNITLPEDRVFEDIEPRLWDVTGDGEPEVVVVLTQFGVGASLVILGIVDGKPQQIASTPYIGQTNRWLAPVGAADLDGDGVIEIAYIDRPHLAKTMRLWRYDNGNFYEAGTLGGLTNHKIGDDFIQGGLRDCGQGPEFITANADWSLIMSTRVRDNQITSGDIADYTGPASIAAALACN